MYIVKLCLQLCAVCIVRFQGVVSSVHCSLCTVQFVVWSASNSIGPPVSVLIFYKEFHLNCAVYLQYIVKFIGYSV